MLRLLQIRVL